MKVAVVTGGAGFIGLNLTEHLLQHQDVIILDNLSEGSNPAVLSKFLSKYKNLKFLKGSILDQDLHDLIESGRKLNVSFDVYHLAAQSHVDRSIDAPLHFTLNNVVGTVKVLDVYRKFPNNMKLCVVSTDEVYGDEGPFPTPLNAPIKTSSPYSASKASADLFVQAYRRTYNLPIKLSRCCNNFGKYQNKEKFIPLILSCMKEQKKVPIYGNGKQMRQWVPVEIHAQRLHEFMQENPLDQHVGGFLCRNLDIIKYIRQATKKSVQSERVQDRPGHDFKYELKDPKSITEEVFLKYMKDYALNFLNG
jgi:dTDP-glucose 4,6-dehydratase